METQEITIRTNHPEEVVKGAAISTCTSELGYDSCTGMFEVMAMIIGESSRL